jgi:DNA polymerase III subunit chi
MTEVSFYHLERTPLKVALPKILEKAHSAGMRTVVIAGSEEHIAELNTALWTYDPDSFLPHGTGEDGLAADQPIYLTTHDENPNAATVLALVDGVDVPDFGKFNRVLDLFDGHDEEAVQAARGRWKTRMDAGHDLTYWQQTPTGGWEKKA